MNAAEKLVEAVKELARQKATVELTEMIPVMKALLGEDFVYYLIVMAALNPDIPMPEKLYNKMVSKGYTPKLRPMTPEEEKAELERVSKSIAEEVIKDAMKH